MPEASATAGRALDAWLARATQRIREHVEEIKSIKSVRNFAGILNARLAAAERDEELLRYVPSKRLRGKVYAAAPQKGNGKKRTHEEQDSKADSQTTTCAFAHATKRKADAFGISTAKSISEISSPIFQIFRYNRLIIDEYTYLDAKTYAFMTSLQASSHWVLSGTPALDDFADVKTMAGFLGINLGVDDDTVGAMKGENIRAIRKDRTAAEHFHSYGHQLQSPKWHAQRHKHAQRFLDQFARQNTAEISEIITKHELKAVNLPAAERAIFLELQQQVITQDMKLRESGKAEIDNDRTKRLNHLMRVSKTPEEALLKCCSHFELPDLQSGEDALLTCDVIVKTREAQYKSLCKKLKHQLERAAWLMQHCESPNTHYSSWKGHVRENSVGDPRATKELVKMIDTAEAQSKEPEVIDFSRNSQTKKRVTLAMRELHNLAGDLRSLSDELVSRARALRFFEAVRRVQLWQSNGALAPVCAYCDRGALAPEKTIILGLCGHIFCEDCRASTESGGYCVISGCRADALDYHKIKACELRHKDPGVTSAPFYGKKT